MKTLLTAALILIATTATAADFAACPVDSTTIDATYGRYVAQNTQTGGYILHRQTVTTLRNLATDTVKAVQDGVVIYVAPYDASGMGYFVAVKHTRQDGSVWYSQNNRVKSSLVNIGDYVTAGQPIAVAELSPCNSSFAFSTTQFNLNSAMTLPVSGRGAFPGVFTDSTSELRAVCQP